MHHTIDNIEIVNNVKQINNNDVDDDDNNEENNGQDIDIKQQTDQESIPTTTTAPQVSNDENEPIVDDQSVNLKVCLYGGKEPTIEHTSLKSTTIKDLEINLRKMFNIDSDRETNVWIHAKREVEPEQTLNDFITSTNLPTSSALVITIEVKNLDGTWPSARPRFGTVSTRSSKATPGLCGLSNMGNTCFMNSALQCLSNTPPLTQYILTDKFVDDINVNNPLGMHGEIARTYADLIKVMWSGNNTSFLPREFKCAVSRFAPQFNGFAQQDCQELMAFLLDGLHEDLNRIREKPYIEVKNETERRPDEVLAEESWSNYKKRNDSIVVDTFHAMLKSTLVCPGCQLVSVTFDPFCYLSLPLPVKREKQIYLIFIPAPSKVNIQEIDTNLLKHLDEEEIETIKQYGGSISSCTGNLERNGCYFNPSNRLKSCKVQVPRSGPVGEICDIVARMINDERDTTDQDIAEKVLAENLVVAELSTDGRIIKVYESNEHYNQLSDDIVVVEKKSNYVIPIYIRDIKHSTRSEPTIFGKATFLHVPDLKYKTLYKSTIASLSNLSGGGSETNSDALSSSEGIEEADVGDNYKNWIRFKDPVEDSTGQMDNAKMNCDTDISHAEEEEEEEQQQQQQQQQENNLNSLPSGDDSATMDCQDEIVTNGDGGVNSNNSNGNDEIKSKTNGISSTSTSSSSSSSTSTAQKGLECNLKLNDAFGLYLVNSSGLHLIEKLGLNKEECDYNSKLYLGATFDSKLTLLPQFKHIRQTGWTDSVQMFTPKVTPKPTLQLKDCISQFANVERLGADDPWYCPKCKKHQQATKKFDIWSLPKVLIIHLKRFSYSRSWRDKIDTMVEFPVDNLDMSKYVLNPSQRKQSKLIYNLIGVANHFGGLGGGHYTAYAKNVGTDSWYSFDDALVTQTSSSNVVTRSAYVLFYQLQEDQDIGN